MDVTEIAGLESELVDFLGEFDDCFGRSEPREHLGTYVSGQLSDLERKSVEPMALAANVPPRTLQRFLELVEWAKRVQLRKLYLKVFDDNSRAISLYDSLGFAVEARLKGDVLRGDGTYGDTLIMARFHAD